MFLNFFKSKALKIFLCIYSLLNSSGYTYAVTTLTERQSQAIKTSQNSIRFEKNLGQLPEKVSYGFLTPFGSMFIEKDRIRLTALQCDPMGDNGSHTVEISFPGGESLSNIEASQVQAARFNYFTHPDPGKAVTNIPCYGELTIKGIFPGIDLRLYSAANSTLEFDWLVAPGADYSRIRMHFTGQDSLWVNKNHNLVLGMRFDNLEMRIPECYQWINNSKKKVDIGFSFIDPQTITYSLNALACQNVPDRNYPLIIDPDIVWSSYFDLNKITAPVFDSYCSGVEIVPCTGEAYIIGSSNLEVPLNYRDSMIGYDNSIPAANSRSGIIYRLNPDGTSCTAFTYFGDNVTIKAISLFPNGNVLIGGSIDSTCNDGTNCLTVSGSVPFQNPYSTIGRGFVAVLDSSLTTLLYSGRVPGLSGNFGSRAWARGGVCAVSVLNDSSYFIGGVANSNSTYSGTSNGVNLVPNTGVPDPVRSGYEAYIARFSGSAFNNKDWATFFGASGDEDIVDMDISQDKTKIVFCSSTTNGSGAPVLVNPFDTISNNKEGLVGVLPTSATPPTAFSMYSYLGGSGDEYGMTIGLDDTYIYTYYTTTTPETAGDKLPGGMSGTLDSTLGGSSDGAVTKAYLNGGFGGNKSTYIGGSDVDLAGCIAVNRNAGEVYLFGTTLSSDFPCTNSSPSSSYYDNTLGSTGYYDITVAFLSTDLRKERYGIYIGGCYDDYMGETGKLFSGDHLSYNYTLDRLGLATTIHSANTAPYGTNCSNGLTAPLDNNTGKFDPSKSSGKEGDAHFIVMWKPNPDGDYGDVPNIYENQDPAVNNVIPTLRFGLLNEADNNPLSSANADGDDLYANSTPCGGAGIPDDEDGIDSAYLPIHFTVKDNSYSVPIQCYNNTGNTATVHAWIDLNRDSIFEASEYASATVPSGGTYTATLNWNLNTLSCGLNLNPGMSYARFRITTQAVSDNAGTAVDERNISYQNDGEVEDYTAYIRGVDWGDLPNPYPLASAVSFIDFNNDNIPDENQGGKEYPVWLGNKVDVECTAHQNSAASADLYDDGVSLPMDSVSPSQTYLYNVTINSTEHGKTVYYGMWFDWNFNGSFTDPSDGFYAGSAITNSPVTVPVSVTTPPFLGTSYALRVIASGDGPVNQSDYNSINHPNGEVEDYIRPAKDFTLPVELNEFNGKNETDHNHIFWSVLAETPGIYYLLQRSANGLQFEDITTVNTGNNYGQRLNYAYDDFDIQASPVYYYRLKMVESDQSFSYSKNIRLVNFPESAPALNVYPNPVSSGALMLNFLNYTNSSFTVILCNAAGEIIDHVDYAVSRPDDLLSISTGHLSSGVYYLRLIGKDMHALDESRKIIILNAGR